MKLKVIILKYISIKKHTKKENTRLGSNKLLKNPTNYILTIIVSNNINVRINECSELNSRDS